MSPASARQDQFRFPGGSGLLGPEHRGCRREGTAAGVLDAAAVRGLTLSSRPGTAGSGRHPCHRAPAGYNAREALPVPPGVSPRSMPRQTALALALLASLAAPVAGRAERPLVTARQVRETGGTFLNLGKTRF